MSLTLVLACGGYNLTVSVQQPTSLCKSMDWCSSHEYLLCPSQSGWRVVCSGQWMLTFGVLQLFLFVQLSKSLSSFMPDSLLKWRPMTSYMILNTGISLQMVFLLKSGGSLMQPDKMRFFMNTWRQHPPGSPWWQSVMSSLLWEATQGWRDLVKTWSACWRVSGVHVHICTLHACVQCVLARPIPQVSVHYSLHLMVI